MITFKEIKQNLLKHEVIELDNVHGDMIDLFLGHQDRFCLMLNAKVIMSVKTWKPIENKLKTFDGLATVENQMSVI